MYYTVYRITHKITKQFYIGRHATKNLDDNYLGSGSTPILRDKPNLEKTILKVCSTPEEMIEVELQLIKEHIKNPLCENLIIGDPSNSGVIQHSLESKKRISKGMAIYKSTNPEKFLEHMKSAGKALKGHKQTENHLKNLSNARKGKPKTDDFKKKVSESLRGRTLRPRNTLCQKWKITNVITNEIFLVEDRVQFCEKNHLKYSSFNVGTRNGVLYKKTWLCEKFFQP